MKYLEVEVKTAKIVHGFDAENKEIVEKVEEKDFSRKILALDRILSVSEEFLLVSSSHGRVMYWEYKDTLANIRKKLEAAGLLLG